MHQHLVEQSERLFCGLLFRLKVPISHVDEAHVLHSTDPELGTEYGVVLGEGEGHLKEVFKEEKRLLGHAEEQFGIEELQLRLSDSEPEGDLEVFIVVLDNLEVACIKAINVSTNRRALFEFVDTPLFVFDVVLKASRFNGSLN